MILQKYEEFYAPANIWDKRHEKVIKYDAKSHSHLNSMGKVYFALIGLLFWDAGIHFGMAFTTRSTSSSSSGSTFCTNSMSLNDPSGST